MSGRGDMNGDLIAGRRVTRMSGNDAAYNSSGVKEVNDGQRLKKVGKQLAGLTKYGKDGVLALLKTAAKIVEESPQRSEEMKIASNDLSRALSKPEILKHRDKEVRLYASLCAVHVLRLHAPDTPFSDETLAIIFHLVISTLKNISDSSSAFFKPSLNLLRVVGKIKCCLLMLDLEESEALVQELFTVLFSSMNLDTYDIVEEPALEVVATVLDESDSISQPLLDCILGHLAPAALGTEEIYESAVTQKFAERILQIAREALQPPVQKFLTQLLDGVRTDSDLVGNPSQLVLQVHKASPQIMLPVLPHLQPSLQVDSEERRLDSVDLICKLLTQDNDSCLLADYPQLSEAVLGRLNDRSPFIRLKVLQYTNGLIRCLKTQEQRSAVTEAVVLRLHDPDEKLRSAAAGAFCSIAGEYPEIVSRKDYEGLISRLRDKRFSVRKEVASSIGKLIKQWCLRCADVSSFDNKKLLIEFIAGLCNLIRSGDHELGAYIEDEVFRHGVLPSTLSPQAASAWWAVLWKETNSVSKSAILGIIKRKCDLQEQMKEVLKLREEAKAERLSRRPLLLQPESQIDEKEEKTATDRLHHRIKRIAAYLRHLPKAEEGLEKIFGMKDNNIFRNLEKMSVLGIDFSVAQAAGKELQSRLGSRGPSADLAQALVARLCPNFITPEALKAAIGISGESALEHEFILEFSKAEPRMFANCKETIKSILMGDDELAASLALQVLSRAGGSMFLDTEETFPEDCIEKIQEFCKCGRPKTRKAAARSLIYAVRNEESGQEIIANMCNESLTALRDHSNMEDHSLLLSHLKVISIGMRMDSRLLEKFAIVTYEVIMHAIIPLDLSMGKPLFNRKGLSSPSNTWGTPSPDVGIKAELIKTLSQCFVLDDASSEIPSMAIDVVKSFGSELQDFTEMDTEAPQFELFNWNLRKVNWVEDDNTDKDSESVIMDPRNYSKEERIAIEKQTADASPDAGWIRLAAGKSLFRLFKSYDAHFSGSDYLGLGLACQDSMVEVRQSLLEKIHSTVTCLQRSGRGRWRQRSAKIAALYALYGADPYEPNVKRAYNYLREFVMTRRAILTKISLVTSTSGGSGTLVNEMPEFILPFLIYFMAHHPDYDAVAMSGIDTGVEALMSLFKDSMQMSLEALIVPRLSDHKDAAAMATEVSNNSGVALKLLRQLKFCDLLDVDAEDQADDVATRNGHQLCDIGLSLTRRIALKLSPVPNTVPSKFTGPISLPKKFFRARTLAEADKRIDGSDLPQTLKAPQLRELFCAAYGKFKTFEQRNKGKKNGKKSQEQVVEQKVQKNQKRRKAAEGIKNRPKKHKSKVDEELSTSESEDQDLSELDAEPMMELRPRKKPKDSIDELFTSSDDEEAFTS